MTELPAGRINRAERRAENIAELIDQGKHFEASLKARSLADLLEKMHYNHE